jgi:hypothetical protein
VTRIAPPNPGSTFNESTGMWTISTLETVWSCPEHEYPTDHRDATDDCDECGSPPEIECLDCLFGEYLVKFDEDGWATLSITRRKLFAVVGGRGDGGWIAR